MKIKKQKNYSAWEIDVNNFPENQPFQKQLAFLLNYAVLAPSTHNSQPWLFSVAENEIIISSALNRRLPFADSNDKHLTISLGAALENLLIAADYFGFEAKTDFNDSSKTIKVSFSSERTAVKKNINHLIFAIPKRRTNRNPYSLQALDPQYIEWVKKLTDNEVEVAVIEDEINKNKLIDIIMDFRVSAFDDKNFRRELADYKKNNFTRSFLGIPGFSMGFPNLLSLLAPFAIRHFSVIRLIRKKEESLLKKCTPVLIFINTALNNPERWLKSGRVLERLVLKAEIAGLKTAISALPFHVEKIQSLLQTKNFPQLLVRIGYTNKIPHPSPRIPAQDITIFS